MTIQSDYQTRGGQSSHYFEWNIKIQNNFALDSYPYAHCEYSLEKLHLKDSAKSSNPIVCRCQIKNPFCSVQ